MQDVKHGFEFINNYFDKIYVISLKGSTSRHESIKHHLNELNYEIFWGTDKRDLPQTITQDTSFYDDTAHRQIKRTKRSMILAECACADSHRRIYKDVIDNDYNRVLIFEDDAIPVLSTIGNVERALNTLPENWDLILFDYYDHYLPSAGNNTKRWIYSILHHLKIGGWDQIPPALIALRNMREYNQYFWRPGKLSGAHAYAVSNNGAKHYLNYQTPIKLQADRIFYFYHAIQALNDFALKIPIFARGEESKTSTIDVPASKKS